MSFSVLSTRLDELTGAHPLPPHTDGYHLTQLGRDLVEALSPLAAWSRRWARETGTITAGGTRGDSAASADANDVK